MAGRVQRRVALQVIYWNVAVLVVVVAMGWAAVVRQVHRYDELILLTSRKHGVDPRLISAVIWKESRFRPHAVGEAGEIGLMQVTEAAAREWARAVRRKTFEKDDLFDPQTNIEAGAWYLSRALAYWADQPHPEAVALAEYNAGRSHAQRWVLATGPDETFQEQITFPSTKKYVRDILRRYKR